MSKALNRDVTDIFFPEVIYPDNTRGIAQYRSNYDQGFNINNIAALSGVKDQKINNFTSFYLTKQELLGNYSNLTLLPSDVRTLTTRLEFYKEDNGIPSQFIYINKDISCIDEADSDTTDFLSISTVPVNFPGPNNYYFELEILDDYFLRVRHNDGSYDYFLHWYKLPGDTDLSLVFIRDSDTESPDPNQESLGLRTDTFKYSINGDIAQGYMKLYKCQLINNTPAIYTLIIDVESGSIKMEPLENKLTFGTINNLIYIDYNVDRVDPIQNNSFISYNTNKVNTLNIDISKSYFDDKGQYIFHIEYNDQDVYSDYMGINFFTLDTNRSEFNFIKRGTNMQQRPIEIPTFNFREYTTLDTGLDYERGNDKISLVYTFYDKDILVRNGTTTLFTTPSSIYPFSRLNINDSTFTRNGAFGGPSPEVSDKVYVLRDGSRDAPLQYENGRYFCTWLSAGDIKSPGVWVDRYYYPDAVTKKDELTADRYEVSFKDSLDRTTANTSLGRENVSRVIFFDKRSDLCLEPNLKIKYERIGNNDLKDIIANSNPIITGLDNKIFSKSLRQINASPPRGTDPAAVNPLRDLGNVTENIYTDSSDDSVVFDGTFYSRLSAFRKINDTSSFTISFDAYIASDVEYGYQILGSGGSRGFGVFQDTTVTPFQHVATNKKLKIFNSDNVKLNEISFATNIKDVYPIIKLSAAEEYIVICEPAGGDVINTIDIYRVDVKGNKLKLRDLGGNTERLGEYVRVFVQRDYVYFLSPDNIVHSLDLDSFELLRVEDVDIHEFNFYNNLNEDSNVFDESDLWKWNYNTNVDTVEYNNIIEYEDKVYLLPGYSGDTAKTVWQGDDVVFYVVRPECGTTYQYFVIKHNVGGTPEVFLKSYEPISDLEIENVGNDINVLVAIKDTIYRYTTNGVFVNAVQYRDLIGDSSDSDIIEDHDILAIDQIREYDVNGLQDGRLVLVTTDALDKLYINDVEVEDMKGSEFVANPITNYNTLKRIYDKTSLKFALSLKNLLNSEDTRRIVFEHDITNIDVGYHTYTYSFNSNTGVAALFVDGILQDSDVVNPYKYNIQDIFSSELFVGSSGFTNGLDLSTYLKQPGYYYTRNLRLKNFYVYNTAASTSLVYALTLINTNIDELVLSIPSGQRNNKTTIDRFYKFGRPNSSNKIDIVVNNLEITDEETLSQIKISILDEAEDFLPAGVHINSIKFSK